MTTARSRSRSSRLGAVLRACVRDHDYERPLAADVLRPLPSECGTLVRRAQLHGVEACVYLSLRFDEALPAGAGDTLEGSYHSALQTHMRATHDLGIAGACLDDAGVAWATFKGPVLAEHFYSRPDLRSYSDLDLLVAPRDLRGAIEALEAAGGALLDRNWRLIRERMSGEVHVRLPTGTIADLHWHLFNQQARRRTFSVRTDDLLARAVTVDVDGSRVRTLRDEDTLVHLALHACQSGGTRLLWCKDLEQVVTRRAVDWDAVVGRALEWNAGPPTALMLSGASRSLGFALPPGVLERLSPQPLWRWLTRASDRWSPPEHWSGGRSIRRDLCLAARGDDRASSVALARRVGSLIKKRDRGAPHETDRDPSHPQSLHHPTADPRDRAEYFAALEAASEPDSRS